VARRQPEMPAPKRRQDHNAKSECDRREDEKPPEAEAADRPELDRASTTFCLHGPQIGEAARSAASEWGWGKSCHPVRMKVEKPTTGREFRRGALANPFPVLRTAMCVVYLLGKKRRFFKALARRWVAQCPPSRPASEGNAEAWKEGESGTVLARMVRRCGSYSSVLRDPVSPANGRGRARDR